MTAWALALQVTSWKAAPGLTTFSQTPVIVQSQPSTNIAWCWLATAAAIDVHHHGATTQCQLADQLLRQQICCANPGSMACDKPGDVFDSLHAVHRWSHETLLNGPPPLASIDAALTANRPPVLQIVLGTSDHAVVLAATGKDPQGQDVVRFGEPDANRNPSDVVWSQASSYRGGLSWRKIVWTS